MKRPRKRQRWSAELELKRILREWREQSVVAFQQFMEVMGREPGSLTITRWAA